MKPYKTMSPSYQSIVKPYQIVEPIVVLGTAQHTSCGAQLSPSIPEIPEIPGAVELSTVPQRRKASSCCSPRAPVGRHRSGPGAQRAGGNDAGAPVGVLSWVGTR